MKLSVTVFNNDYYAHDLNICCAGPLLFRYIKRHANKARRQDSKELVKSELFDYIENKEFFKTKFVR